MRYPTLLLLAACASPGALAQQKPPPPDRPEKTAKPGAQPEEFPPRPDEKERPRAPEAAPDGEGGDETAKLKWDMAEHAPIVTHHQLGKLHYTATAGRMPIEDPAGGIEAEMFFVAYTLDGADPHKRPVTFAFNGGPGSASLWIHMGALSPRKVVLEKEGWMPPGPYRLADNPQTPLDKTDLVLVDAVGTGFSRPADMKKAKKFWGLKGDARAFGELIRMYLTRYQRWGSPLYLLGESYGTTRSAEVASYLIDRGVAFNGIMLLSMVLDFETLETNPRNDLAFELTLPAYTMIALYHHKLAADLSQDPEKTRREVVRWATGEYAAILAKGDDLTQPERQAAIAQVARWTGLKPEIVDWANLRIDVGTFTHYLLADEKLRVGRLDGRFKAPDPEGFMHPGFYDPSMTAVAAPITSVFNDYVRTALGFATDLPYYTSAGQLSPSPEFRFWRKWEWGSAIEGFPDTATSLRAAMVKNPWMKVMVMEGVYDLATPFAAADYTMSHLDLPPSLRKNLSTAVYDSGHMVYVREGALAKFHDDVGRFIDATLQ
ncbi:MAG: S10 family peptidase [Myxococcales bacterium]